MKKLLTILPLILIGFTSSVFSKTFYEEISYNKPILNLVTEVYLGDRMLIQQVGEWRECITPTKTFTKKQFGGWNFLYKADEPICKIKPEDKDYRAQYQNANDKYLPVRLKEKKGKYTLCQWELVSTGCIKNLTESDWKKDEKFFFKRNSFQQTIEYSGKRGESLRFTYLEFQENIIRDSFTREFEIDLSEGNVAAYKGAIIEILDASNTTIKFKVIRNFTK